jgi:methionine synthase II (cobalamin-independent)
MFSTLLGALPASESPAAADSAEDPLASRIRALEDAGLDLLASGAPPAPPSVDPDEVVAAWRLAAGLTAHPVKVALLGPFSAAIADGPKRVAATIRALAAAGCPMVDIVEPDLTPIAASRDERSRFVDAHRALFGALGSAEPAIHCSLVVGGGNVDTSGPATFFDLPYPSYAFDLIEGPDNWRLIAAAPTDRGIVCGALAARVGGDETPDLLVWAAHYAASTGGRGLDRVGLANAGSLAALPWDVAVRKVRRIAEAARIAAQAPDEAAGRLDPRAFGGRRNRPGGRAVSLEPPNAE